MFKNIGIKSWGIILIMLICIVCFLYYSIFSKDFSLSDIALSIGTNLIAVLIVLISIDIIVDQNKKRQNERMRRLAYKRLRVSFNRHLLLWFRIYKATYDSSRVDRPINIATFFEDKYFRQIIKLDFTSDPGFIAVDCPSDWYAYLRSSTNEFRDALEQTMIKYGIFLTDDAFIMEELINSHFVAVANRYPEAVEYFTGGRSTPDFFNIFLMKNKEDTNGIRVIDYVKIYLHLFASLIEKYNEQFPNKPISIPKSYWNNHIEPKIGSGIITNKTIQQRE